MGDVRGKTIAILGLAFKPETDDMREAPALVVIDKLLQAGATVRVFDPIAMADALVLMTEWRQFRMPTWNVIQKVMKGCVVVDGRNIWNRQELEDIGYLYTRIGEK